jgi:L-threonylcarbamoyladenylate synthase
MERVIPEINRLATEQEKAGKKVGVICTDETREQYTTGDIKSIGLRAEDETIAHHLFAILRDFDEDGVEVIYSEAFDTPRMGQAIMNRLLKAAGHKVAEV